MSRHIDAKPDQIAKFVILVGDPNRADYIANKFLTDVQRYTDYRLMYGYTGLYKGKPISIQTTGMGSPSISIIVEELHTYGVKTLVRLGTAGVIQDIDLYDIIIGNVAHSSHDIYARVFPGASYSAAANFKLVKMLYESAQKLNFGVHCGSILTSETFYEDDGLALYKKFADYGTLAVEMESYPLYALSEKYKINAATVLTVSDDIFASKTTDRTILLNSVDKMTQMILDTAINNYEELCGQ